MTPCCAGSVFVKVGVGNLSGDRQAPGPSRGPIEHRHGQCFARRTIELPATLTAEESGSSFQT